MGTRLYVLHFDQYWETIKLLCEVFNHLVFFCLVIRQICKINV